MNNILFHSLFVSLLFTPNFGSTIKRKIPFMQYTFIWIMHNSSTVQVHFLLRKPCMSVSAGDRGHVGCCIIWQLPPASGIKIDTTVIIPLAPCTCLSPLLFYMYSASFCIVMMMRSKPHTLTTMECYKTYPQNLLTIAFPINTFIYFTLCYITAEYSLLLKNISRKHFITRIFFK